MESLVMFCVSLYIVAGVVVGVRLLRIALRSKGVPEAALGATLFCFAALSQPAAMLAEIAKQQEAAAVVGVAGIVSWIGTFAALCGLAVFTWQAFRPAARWAAVLCFAAIAVDALAIGSLIRSIHLGQIAPTDMAPALALSCVVFAVVFAWGGVEGLAAYSAARKRERLGLGDSVVTNRFLLWSVSSLGGFVTDVLLIPIVLSGADLTKDPSPQLAVAGSALLNAICWWLAFAPPPAYTRWMAGRGAKA